MRCGDCKELNMHTGLAEDGGTQFCCNKYGTLHTMNDKCDKCNKHDETSLEEFCRGMIDVEYQIMNDSKFLFIRDRSVGAMDAYAKVISFLKRKEAEHDN